MGIPKNLTILDREWGRESKYGNALHNALGSQRTGFCTSLWCFIRTLGSKYGNALHIAFTLMALFLFHSLFCCIAWNPQIFVVIYQFKVHPSKYLYLAYFRIQILSVIDVLPLHQTYKELAVDCRHLLEFKLLTLFPFAEWKC